MSPNSSILLQEMMLIKAVKKIEYFLLDIFFILVMFLKIFSFNLNRLRQLSITFEIVHKKSKK